MFLDAFLSGLSMRLPLLVLSAAGIVLVWVRVRPHHFSAFVWSSLGLATLALRCVIESLGRAQTADLFQQGVRGTELVSYRAVWTLTEYVLLFVGFLCMLIAVLLGRSVGPKAGSPPNNRLEPQRHE